MNGSLDTSWLSQSRLHAHLDRLAFTIEPAAPTARRIIAKHLPPRVPRGSHSYRRGMPRWYMREVGTERGTRFQVLVQDPQSMVAIVDVVDRLSLGVPLLRDPQLDLLEVALDVWPTVPGSLDLARVAAFMFKCSKLEPSANSRAAGAPGRPVLGLLRPDGAYLALRDRYSLYCGNHRDPCMLRGYVKVTDNSELLPQNEHRARFEVQLRHGALPVRTIRELASFRFETMATSFAMWRPRHDLPSIDMALAERLDKLRRHAHRRRGTRPSYRFLTTSFDDFNAGARVELAALTRAMQHAQRTPYRVGHLSALAAYRTRVTTFSAHPRMLSNGSDAKSGATALTTLDTAIAAHRNQHLAHDDRAVPAAP